MYTAFALSGAVDLVALSVPGGLPRGVEQVFLPLAFVVETLLMGKMHIWYWDE